MRPLLATLLLAGFCPFLSGANSGADVYADHCASCHGADGRGRTPAGRKLGAKDLTKSALPDAAVRQQIVSGSRNERGAERMPAFQEKLEAAQVEALVAYVKSLRR